MSQRIRWTKARRKVLQEIEVADMVRIMRSSGRTLSRATLKAVVLEYIRQVNPAARPDPRQSSQRDSKGRPQFDPEDSETLLKRIAEDAVRDAKKR